MIRTFCDRRSLRTYAIGMLLVAAGLSLAGAAAEPATAATNEPTALKIGLLLDLSSGSAQIYRDRQRAFELAIKHVNEGRRRVRIARDGRGRATPRPTRRRQSRQHGVSWRSRVCMPSSAPTPARARCRWPSR